jgi:aminoglycoside phosphotransferase (APT) family kinase protein
MNATPPVQLSETGSDDWLLGFEIGRLEHYLSCTLAGVRPPLSIHAAPHGGAGTYVLSSPDTRYVMRRQADAAPGSAQMLEREFRILAALHQRRYPVPQPLLYCDHERPAGAPFYIAAETHGRVFSDATLPGRSPSERAALYDATNAALAQLHTIEPHQLGVADLGNGRHYVADQIGQLSLRYRGAGLDEIPEMENLIRWLPRNLPAEPAPRLVHGNFHIGNVVFDPEQPKVIAVLDWRSAALGDPIADAVSHFVAWILGEAEGNSTPLSAVDLGSFGIPSLEAYAATYAARAGLRTLPSFETYFAYSLFRAAVQRGLSGVRKGDGRVARSRAFERVKPIAVLAWAFARRAGAK